MNSKDLKEFISNGNLDDKLLDIYLDKDRLDYQRNRYIELYHAEICAQRRHSGHLVSLFVLVEQVYLARTEYQHVADKSCQHGKHQICGDRTAADSPPIKQQQEDVACRTEYQSRTAQQAQTQLQRCQREFYLTHRTFPWKAFQAFRSLLPAVRLWVLRSSV